MRVYVVGHDERQRTGIFRTYVTPAADPAMLQKHGREGMPEEWFEMGVDPNDDAKMRKQPASFCVTFVNGVSEDQVPDSVYRYMLDRKLAQKTSLIVA